MEDFSVAGFKFKADKDVFSPDLNESQKKVVFKKAVSRVVLEISSYCNRQCVFCPNSLGFRLGKENRLKSMPLTLIESIAASLSEIEYAGSVLLHLYNEPTADPELVKKVKILRDKLPNARISFNTSGDYLSNKMLENLVEAGLSSLSISLYGPEHGKFEEDYLERSFARFFEIVGNKGRIERKSDTEIVAVTTFETKKQTLPIRIFAIDFNKVGYDRAQSVRSGKTEVRSSPCPAPFAELNVAWDGHVVPCCNIHPETALVDGQVVGRVEKGSDIFDIYSGPKLRGWRKALAKYGDSKSPCDTCTRLNEPELAGSESSDIHNRRMSEIM